MEDFLKIMPDKEKAKSILKMVNITLEMIKLIDKNKFPSNVIKEYYEVIRELISIILLLDGYKAIGEKAHKKQIEYLESKCKEFNKPEIMLIDELRIIRNRISYDGFFIKNNYVNRRYKEIKEIIIKLKSIVNKKII